MSTSRIPDFFRGTYEETRADGTRDGDQLNVSRQQVTLSLLDVERVDMGTLSDSHFITVNIVIRFEA